MENKSTKCRLCGCSENVEVNVLEFPNLIKDIHLYTTVLISSENLLPTKICTKCNSTLEDILSFRSKCIQVQEMLHDHRSKLSEDERCTVGIIEQKINISSNIESKNTKLKEIEGNQISESIINSQGKKS